MIFLTRNGNKITLKSNADAKYVELSVNGNTSLFSDNYFDLKKGEERTVSLIKKPNAEATGHEIRVKNLFNVLSQ